MKHSIENGSHTADSSYSRPVRILAGIAAGTSLLLLSGCGEADHDGKGDEYVVTGKIADIDGKGDKMKIEIDEDDVSIESQLGKSKDYFADGPAMFTDNYSFKVRASEKEYRLGFIPYCEPSGEQARVVDEDGKELDVEDIKEGDHVRINGVTIDTCEKRGTGKRSRVGEDENPIATEITVLNSTDS